MSFKVSIFKKCELKWRIERFRSISFRGTFGTCDLHLEIPKKKKWNCWLLLNLKMYVVLVLEKRTVAV